LDPFAERFAAAGIAALLFDHRGFGDSQGEPDPAYSPIRDAATLHCPWLVCVAASDRVAKPGSAIDETRRAPQGHLRVYPGLDHFDIYERPGHEAVVADEVEFLRRHLL
jgi:alpha-beta hydrolase superfamily lysophospholipase